MGSQVSPHMCRQHAHPMSDQPSADPTAVVVFYLTTAAASPPFGCHCQGQCAVPFPFRLMSAPPSRTSGKNNLAVAF